MRQLDDSLLVTADEPLNDFLPTLVKPPFYKLVLEGSKITGIVTRSDMLKLPVRLYGFALVTNLELVMTEIIQSHFEKDEEWLIFLTDNQQAKIKRQKRNYEKQRMDPPLIEMTNFGDKITILEKLPIYPDFFINELKDIEKELRNPLAHSVTFAPNKNKMKRFVDLTRLTQNCTNKLLTNLVDEKKGKLC